MRTRPLSSALPAAQGELFGEALTVPAGVRYRPDLIDADEEAELARRLAGLPFEPFDFHGHLANRHVVGFGLRYDSGRRRVVEAAPIPAWLRRLRERIAAFAGSPAEAFVQVLINDYRPGAGVGWHRDKPHFDRVVAVSLLAASPLRLRRRVGEAWDRWTTTVAPRSVYLLSGAARREWEHSIPPVSEHRYSITFRTLADSGRGPNGDDPGARSARRDDCGRAGPGEANERPSPQAPAR